MTGFDSKRKAAQDKLARPEQEPVCPECKAGVLYECVACSSNNYPAQPVQEPWREFASDYERGVIDGRQKQMQSSVDKAVNAMTQRTWVVLTDKEIEAIWKVALFADYGVGAELSNQPFVHYARAIEAKLKEKNT